MLLAVFSRLPRGLAVFVQWPRVVLPAVSTVVLAVALLYVVIDKLLNLARVSPEKSPTAWENLSEYSSVQ